MFKVFKKEVDFGGKKISLETGKVARQADGAIIATCGETVENLKEFSFVIRKTLSNKINMKFLPKLLFVKDESFDYAEKIENLIKQTNK